jgi:hypothetical protein
MLQKKAVYLLTNASESVGLFLASFSGIQGTSGTPGRLDEKGKCLEKQKIAVS